MGITIKKNKEAAPAELGAQAAAAATPAPTKQLKKPGGTAKPDTAPEPVLEKVEEVEQNTTVIPVAEIETQHADGAVENESVELPPVQVPVQHAEVGLTMGLTKNLGDYNSMRFSVSLKIPCAVEPEEIEDTYNSVKGWVDEKVNAINAEINEQLG